MKKFGFWQKIAFFGENQTDYAWTVDGFNRLTQKSWNSGSNEINYSYDSSNNMVGEDHDKDGVNDVHYTYDKLNRLITFSSDAAAVSYSYDPFNRRTKKTVTYVEGSDTFERIHKYLYDGWNIVSEEIKTVCTSDDPDTVTEWKLNRYIDHGMDNHVMMETVDCDDDNGNCDPDETTVSKIWFHKDERGNVIAISDGDGIIYERYRYNVYGEHLVLDENFDTKTTPAISPFLWGGSLYEPETDLYWMRNRYYHKDMHRFINQDPIGIWGDANNLGNGFAYVAGMVIEASDPSGLLQLSAGVNIDKMSNEISDLLVSGGLIDQAVQESIGADEGIITSAYRNSAGSKHNSGNAIDLSLRYGKNGAHLSLQDARKFAILLKEKLGNNFDVVVEHKDSAFSRSPGKAKFEEGIYEMKLDDDKGKPVATGSHVHIEWDPKNKEDSKEKPDPDKTPETHGSGKEDVKQETTTEEVEIEFEVTEEYWESYINAKGELVIEKKYRTKKVKMKVQMLSVKNGDVCYPVPGEDDPADKMQAALMKKLIEKMLKQGEGEQPPVLTDNSTGPNGAIMFFRNPYYINKDPMKSIFFDGNDGSGRPMILRNPFAPKDGVLWSNTYEMWQMRGIIQPEVDPWE